MRANKDMRNGASSVKLRNRLEQETFSFFIKHFILSRVPITLTKMITIFVCVAVYTTMYVEYNTLFVYLQLIILIRITAATAQTAYSRAVVYV